MRDERGHHPASVPHGWAALALALVLAGALVHGHAFPSAGQLAPAAEDPALLAALSRLEPEPVPDIGTFRGELTWTSTNGSGGLVPDYTVRFGCGPDGCVLEEGAGWMLLTDHGGGRYTATIPPEREVCDVGFYPRSEQQYEVALVGENLTYTSMVEGRSLWPLCDDAYAWDFGRSATFVGVLVHGSTAIP